MKWLSASLFLATSALSFAQNVSSNWPMPVSPMVSKAPDRPVDLAPDLANVDLPINHAKLIWFVSVRELPRPGIQPMDRVVLGKMIDADLATCATFTQPRKYELVFDLQRSVLLNRLTVLTDVPSCPISVRVSGTDLSQDEGKGWREVGNTTTKVPYTSFNFSFEPVRFVHMTIDTSKTPPGEALNIYELCVFGQEDLRDFALKAVPEKEQLAREQFVNSSNVGNYPAEMLMNNIASLDAGASAQKLGKPAEDKKISYIIDDDPETYWKADPADKETLVLIDFGVERKINRFSMMHSSRPGKLLVYCLKNLPGQKSQLAPLAWLERMTDVPLFRFAQNTTPSPTGVPPSVTSEWLEAQTPIGSIDTGASNYSTFASESQTGRYLVFRYLNPMPGSGDPLLINGISVLGNYSKSEYVLMPRTLPVIASFGANNLGAPNSGDVGVSIQEQLKDAGGVVTPPTPTPATP